VFLVRLPNVIFKDMFSSSQMTILKTTEDRFVTYAAQKSLVAVINVLTSKVHIDTEPQLHK